MTVSRDIERKNTEIKSLFLSYPTMTILCKEKQTLRERESQAKNGW